MSTGDWAYAGLGLAVIAGMFFGSQALWRWLGSRLYSPPLPYYGEAITFLWNEVYAQYGKPQPRVFWIEITDKNRCRPGGYTSPRNGCVAGEAVPGRLNAINVAWEPGYHAYLADTALCHELAHLARGHQGGDTHAHDDAHARLTLDGESRLRAWEERKR